MALNTSNSLRGRSSKGKGEGEFERKARSWNWGSSSAKHDRGTHPHDRASHSLSRFALELPFSLPLRTPATQATLVTALTKTVSPVVHDAVSDTRKSRKKCAMVFTAVLI